jgi:glucose/arabinose dehydrogenase/PKD repeat protein
MAVAVVMSAQASVQAPSAPSAPTAPTTVPAGFEDTLIASVSGPIDMDWTPDGRMLIISKGGQVRVYQGGALLPTPALDLSAVLCTVGEQGLVGIAVHPNFATNHYIYLYYIYNKFNNACPESEIDGPVGRLSRFELPASNVIAPSSEVVLLETPPRYKNHHTGGDMRFGKDGYLWMTLGDAGAQSLGWPQDLGKLAGKVVRVTDTGGIPPGNPYTGAGTARCNVGGVPPAGSPAGTKCQEVYSYGFRNNFRMAMDPNAIGVRFYINDVGQHTWEDISEGPIAGANYGWPIMEGPCAKDSDTDCTPRPGLTDPIHWYHHVPPYGAAVTGAAFVPNGVWPASYDGTYLFADYVFGKIYQLLPSGGACRLCVPPTSAFTHVEFGSIPDVVSMRFGPHGTGQALYYATRFGSEIHRIAFTGSANRSPVAQATAEPTSGPVPLGVVFNGSGSSDPDLDPLTYEWDFESDGTPDSTAVNPPPHQYTTAGTFTAKLTVRDGRGGEGSTTIQIGVGNSPPDPVIETPAAGTQFAVGDSFVLHGSATDPDEPDPLPDSALTWEVLRHHATHTHPHLDPTPGNDLPLPTGEPEDLDAAQTSYFEIRLTATDSQGLSRTVTRNLDPKKVNVTFSTAPTGLQLNVSGNTLTGPTTVVSWEGYNLTASAPTQTDGSGRTWAFDFWSDGGAATHMITTPASPASYGATFREIGTRVLTFTPTDDTVVRADKPNNNYGGDFTFEAENEGPKVKHSLLKFMVSGIGADQVQSVKLRIYCVDPSPVSGGIFYALENPAAAWSESTVTWNNAPPASATPLPGAELGPTTANTWYEVDVTQLLTSNGPASLRITSPSDRQSVYSSKEGPPPPAAPDPAFAPQLIVTVGPETEPPTDPTDLHIVTNGSSQVALGWTASGDNVGVTNYRIWRNGLLRATVGAVTTYTDSTASSTHYDYNVQALDAAGNSSGLSNTLPVDTPGNPTLACWPFAGPAPFRAKRCR